MVYPLLTQRHGVPPAHNPSYTLINTVELSTQLVAGLAVGPAFTPNWCGYVLAAAVCSSP